MTVLVLGWFSQLPSERGALMDEIAYHKLLCIVILEEESVHFVMPTYKLEIV